MNRRIGRRQCNTKNTIRETNSGIVQLNQTIDRQQFFTGIENAGILDQDLLRCSWIRVDKTLHVDKQTIALFARQTGDVARGRLW